MLKNPGNNRRQARRLNANSQFQGALNRGNKIDFLKFNVSSQSRFSATLTGLRSNADLALFRGRRLLRQSTRPGKRNETIQALLKPGTYFLRVASRGARTRYQLQLATSAPATTGGPTPPNPTLERPTQWFYSYEFGYERLPRNPVELTLITGGIGSSVGSFLGDEPDFFIALLNQYGPEIANSVYSTAMSSTVLRESLESSATGRPDRLFVNSRGQTVFIPGAPGGLFADNQPPGLETIYFPTWLS